MVRGRNTKGLVALFVLSVTALAAGTPTFSDHDGSVVAHVVSPQPVESGGLWRQVPPIAGLGESTFAALAAEFHKPSVISSDSPAAVIDTKSLPPVPGALLMALVGFLCVTLVRDRRFWLAGLLGMLWAGQTGFSFVPHLASRMTGEKQSEQHSSSSKVGGLCEPKHSFRRRGEIDSTCYTGLLRHLAGIPNGRTSAAFSGLFRSSQSAGAFAAPRFCTRSRFVALAESLTFPRTGLGSGSVQSAIVRWALCSICASNCMAPSSRQPICLSTVFGGPNTARGPPGPA
ncbi:MAG: hypothetical protein CEE38_05660 [Planctomycetes bacterium B3_Pla]|nr:MAG: hypothetical protein CEE38_05660 [Planctomycetes bacterium B3_Pla]